MRAPVEADRDPNKHWLGEVQPIGIVVTGVRLVGARAGARAAD